MNPKTFSCRACWLELCLWLAPAKTGKPPAKKKTQRRRKTTTFFEMP